jgi:hypothetical protein
MVHGQRADHHRTSEGTQLYDENRTMLCPNKHDLLIVMGDMNTKVGNERLGIESVMGKHGCSKLNENGERPINICLENKLTIGGTIFQYRDIHKLTWKSPDEKTVYQIDQCYDQWML